MKGGEAPRSGRGGIRLAEPAAAASRSVSSLTGLDVSTATGLWEAASFQRPLGS